jgi:hypothetical protein
MAALVATTLVGTVEPDATRNLPGTITVSFVYVGLTCPRRRSLAVVPFGVVAFIMGGVKVLPGALPTVAAAAIMWVLVAEVPAWLIAQLEKQSALLRKIAQTDALTQLLDRSTLGPNFRGTPVRPPSCSSTWTTSSVITTATATRPGTSCWWPSPTPFAGRCARATSFSASAVTSSSFCWSAPVAPTPKRCSIAFVSTGPRSADRSASAPDRDRGTGPGAPGGRAHVRQQTLPRPARRPRE